MHALTKNLAIELAPYKIRVNAISPVLPTFNAMHPLGRNGQPAAEVLLFLASDQASFITGVVPSVDSGVMAGRQ